MINNITPQFAAAIACMVGFSLGVASLALVMAARHLWDLRKLDRWERENEA